MERIVNIEGYIVGSFGFIESDSKSQTPFKEKRTQVLMVKRMAPPFADHWSLPGGGVLKDETHDQACLREVREEIGIDVKIENYLGRIRFLGDDEKKYEAHVYRCRPPFSFKNLREGEEVSGIGKIDIRSLKKNMFESYPIAPPIWHLIQKINSKESTPYFIP